MTEVQIVNGVVCALGATMGVVLAVVCLLYAVHLDAAPRLKVDLPMLLAFTGAFAVLGASGGLAFAAQRRRWSWRWIAQVLPVVPAAALALLLLQLRG